MPSDPAWPVEPRSTSALAQPDAPRPDAAASVLRQIADSQAAFASRSQEIAELPEPGELPEHHDTQQTTRLGNPLVAIEPLLAGIRAVRSDVQLSAAPAAGGKSSVKLPEGLLASRDGRVLVSLRLANGLALPAWIRFDPQRGEIQVDTRQLQRYGQLDLQLRGQDGQGHQATVKLHLHAGQGQAQAEPLPGSQGLDAQLQGGVSGSWMSQAQALLVTVFGQR